MSIDTNTGRVAVITGASSGIGEATARALAADGYRVALLARRADRIQALADELGDGAIAVEADLTDRDSLVAAAQRVKDELGGVDVLVNNAGARSPARPRSRPAGYGAPRRAHDPLTRRLLGPDPAASIYPDAPARSAGRRFAWLGWLLSAARLCSIADITASATSSRP